MGRIDPNVTQTMWAAPMSSVRTVPAPRTPLSPETCGRRPWAASELCTDQPWGPAAQRPTVADMAVEGSLLGNLALMTGAASGVDRACAVRLPEAVADVVVVDPESEAADPVAA